LFGTYNGVFIKRHDAETVREREGKRPDGTPVKLGFSLAFAEDKRAPDIHFATCQQHFPENFWNSAFQKHANSATGIAGVALVAAEPERHRGFMQTFTGGEAIRSADGFSIATPRGTIEMTAPAAFSRRFGVAAPDTAGGARLAAIRFTVVDASLLQNMPELAGVAGLYAGNAALIGADDAMGAVIVFEPSR